MTRIYILTLIGLMIFSAIGKIVHLTKENGDRTTPRAFDAADIIIGLGLIVWGVVALP